MCPCCQAASRAVDGRSEEYGKRDRPGLARPPPPFRPPTAAGVSGRGARGVGQGAACGRVAWPRAGCWGYRVLSGPGQEKADKRGGY